MTDEDLLILKLGFYYGRKIHRLNPQIQWEKWKQNLSGGACRILLGIKFSELNLLKQIENILFDTT
jgi:hypothetical protein